MICFFLVLLIPLVILFQRSYRQLENESYYQYRTIAEGVVAQIHQRVLDFLRPEEDRVFEEYQFFKAMGPTPGVLQLSPLSMVPPNPMFPGMIGYFQIDPQGGFSSPLLPTEDEKRVHWAALGISPQGLMHRRSLNARMLRALERLQLIQNTTPAANEGAPRADAPIVPEGESGTPQVSRLGEDPPPKDGKKDAKNEKISDLNLDSTLMIEQESTQGTVIFKGNVVSQLEARFRKRTMVSPPNTEGTEKKEIGPPEVEYLKEPSIFGSTLHRTLNFPNASLRDEAVERKAPQYSSRSVLAPPSLLQPVGPFETEMDPLQVSYSEDGVLAFYRKVWRGGQRYVQGFLVNADQFMKATVESTFYNSPLSRESSLLIGKEGQLVRKLEPRLPEANVMGPAHSPLAGEQAKRGNIVLLKSHFFQPLNALELWFTVPSIPKGPGYMVVWLLGIVLFFLFFFGFFGVYRLVAEQMEMAAQRSDFVSAVSHELKTPLTSIRMYGEMLRSGWVQDPEKQKKYFDFIFFESERLSRLIANVLQLSRVSKHEIPLELKEHRVKTLFESIRSKIATQIEASGFEFQFNVEAQDVYVKADEDALTQVIINLVDNAIKFSTKSEKKRIELHGRRVGDEFWFCVRDFGPGIPRDQVKRVFDLFYRVENELTRTTPGTGIGLALVSQLTEKMNAKVDLENKEPGVEFRVRFGLSNPKSVG